MKPFSICLVLSIAGLSSVITGTGIGGQPIIDNITVGEIIAVPEPTTMTLLFLGAAGAVAKRLKGRRAS